MSKQKQDPIERSPIRESDMTGYMCFEDYASELPTSSCGAGIYPTIDSCRQGRPCVEICGMAQVKIRLYWNLDEEPKDRFASVPTLCFISKRELKAFGKGEPMMAYAHADECREYSQTTGAIVAVEVRLSGSIAGFGRRK